jgi:hypothetical protein
MKILLRMMKQILIFTSLFTWLLTSCEDSNRKVNNGITSDKMKISNFSTLKPTLTEKISKIKGIKIEEKFNNKVAIFDSTLSSAEIEEFVNILYNYESAFSFYDRLYPSPSDPGAYTSYFRKENSESWKMTLGNHGWSGGIYSINKEVIYKQLNNLIHSSQLTEIQFEGVVTFSHYEEEPSEKNKKQNDYIREIHKER